MPALLRLLFRYGSSEYLLIDFVGAPLPCSLTDFSCAVAGDGRCRSDYN